MPFFYLRLEHSEENYPRGNRSYSHHIVDLPFTTSRKACCYETDCHNETECSVHRSTPLIAKTQEAWPVGLIDDRWYITTASLIS